MPALITHYLLAEDVIAGREGFDGKQREAFLLGAQGPDAMFFHRLPVIQPGKSYRKYGFALHKQDPDLLMQSFARYLLDNPNKKLSHAFVLGFISHYALDRTAHPFVYAVQNSIVEKEKIRYNPGCVHSRIEHSLDVIMLREKLELCGTEMNPASCLTRDSEVLDEVSDVMTALCNDIFGENITSKNKMIQVYRDFYVNMRRCHDPHTIKSALAKTAETIFFQPPSLSTFFRPIMEDGKVDYSNYEQAYWKNPFDKNAIEQDLTFIDLFTLATEDANALIDAFTDNLYAQNTELTITQRRSFKTGLPLEE